MKKRPLGHRMFWLVLAGCAAALAGGALADRPPSGADRPPSGADRPPSGADRPPSGADRPPSGADRPPSIDRVIEVMDELYRSKSSTSRIELTVNKPGRTRTMRMKSWTRGLDKALIVIESPARDKGTATLKVDNNLWNYLPKISRTVRIPPSMMLNSWMGSDFTNDDLVREASYQKDFDASWGPRSSKPAGWTLVLTAKPGKVGLWKRVEMVINDEGTLPRLARYYDRKGRLGRTMYFEDVKSMGGRSLPTTMRMVPADKPNQSTVMRYLDIRFDTDVPESTFSLSRLKRGR